MATTADYLNKLISQKNTLADNLVIKGITASYDETLETLVPKVLNISGSGGDGNTVLSFKNENLLLNATPYTPSDIEIIQTDSKVTITVPDGSSPQWFKLFDYSDFKINTFYKISVNTFGYGRIGISNSSSNPHNISSSAVSANTNACVFSNAISKEGEIKGDNYLINSENYSALFIINLYSGSDTNITQSGSIWFCNDQTFNDKREGFSFEISLQEQDKFIWDDSKNIEFGNRYYIYNNGQELNGNTLTLYHANISSEKTASWIYMYYWYRGVIRTNQLSFSGYKKIGVCVSLKRNGTATPFFTKISLRSSGNVELSGNDYIPTGDVIGTEYALINNTIDSTVTKYEGIYYIDVPEGIDSGYFVIDSVNVDVYVIGIWLE